MPSFNQRLCFVARLHPPKDLKSTEGRGQARWLKWQDAVSNLRYAGGM